jgi:U3 small nucleolar RNA-associated protein 18
MPGSALPASSSTLPGTHTQSNKKIDYNHHHDDDDDDDDDGDNQTDNDDNENTKDETEIRLEKLLFGDDEGFRSALRSHTVRSRSPSSRSESSQGEKGEGDGGEGLEDVDDVDVGFYFLTFFLSSPYSGYLSIYI